MISIKDGQFSKITSRQGGDTTTAVGHSAVSAERGMVTVELVFGLLIVSIMMAVFGWAIMLFGVEVGCIDTAKDIARQAARGDQEAVRTEESQSPHGAKIDIKDRGAEIMVVVKVHSKPFDFIPAVTLTAQATALREPGER
jgi:type IV secretory pathway TrbD component